MAVVWLDKPQDHDYEAAADYLGMIVEPHAVEKTIAALRGAKPVYRKAKDNILRAARPALCPAANPHVSSDLSKAGNGEKLSIPCHLVSWES